MIQLEGITTFNKGMGHGKLSTMLDGGIVAGDAIPEWAARLCYASNDKFGKNPKFISKLIGYGHYDVIEHAMAAFRFTDTDCENIAWLYEALFNLKSAFPYLYVDIIEVSIDKCEFVLYGNLRVWHEIMTEGSEIFLVLLEVVGQSHYLLDWIYIENALWMLAPNIFPLIDFNDDITEIISMRRDIQRKIDIYESFAKMHEVWPVVTESGAIVSLLGYCENKGIFHATFQFDNVSRSFTHQHVRHRLLSHSQESQRYVSMDDEQILNIVYPHAMTAVQRVSLTEVAEEAMGNYHLLRGYGATKEDARAVLPNCTSTKIISSAFEPGWDHYIKLRTAKDAQHEIRAVAKAVGKMLGELR